MGSRISPGVPSGPDPTPFILTIGDWSVPFASLTHPGWEPFIKRIDKEHNSYAMAVEHGEGLDDETRRLFIGLALDDLSNQKEGALSESAQHYLNSAPGLLDYLVEGICLANPSAEREQVWKEVGKLTMSDIHQIEIRPSENE
jgi:hypothetical protein